MKHRALFAFCLASIALFLWLLYGSGRWRTDQDQYIEESGSRDVKAPMRLQAEQIVHEAAARIDRLTVTETVRRESGQDGGPTETESEAAVDPEWESINRYELDVMKLLAEQPLVCGPKTLSRSVQLNPRDVVLPPSRREELVSLLDHYRKQIRLILQEIQLVRHQDLKKLRQSGRLPRIIDAVTQDMLAEAVRKTPGMTLENQAAQSVNFRKNQEFANTLLNILFRKSDYNNFITHEGEIYVGKRQWCEMAEGLRKAGNLEFLIGEMGAAVVSWFWSSAATISDAERDDLLALFFGHLGKFFQR